MTTRLRPAAALVAGLALLLAACGSSAPFAARVDGRSIGQDALEDELRFIASNEEYLSSIEERLPVRGLGQGTFDAAFTAEVLTRQILYSLVRSEVDRRDLQVSERDLDAARPAVAQQTGGTEVLDAFPAPYRSLLVRRAAELNTLTISLIGQLSGEEAARTYYESHPDEFRRACVRHVLVDSLEKANAVKGRLDGGQDFAAVARAESQDTLTAGQGGDLGCDITPDTPFVGEFLAAVFAQPVGEAGPPVQTSFGFHVIKVTSREVPPFEAVAPDALRKVVAGGQPKLREWLEVAIDRAEITVAPRYGTFQKAGVSSAVVPPQAPSTSVAPAPAPG